MKKFIADEFLFTSDIVE